MKTEIAPPPSPVLGAAIVVGFALVAGLVFAAILLAVPQNNHFFSLLAVGILCLVFSLGAYLAQAAVPSPGAIRALSWGFGGAGFTVLFGTILFDSAGILFFLEQLVAVIIVALFLLVALGGAYWRHRALALTAVRMERRADWQSQAPRSALDYPAAQHDREVTSSSSSATKGPP
ncbi:MAG: hypothetical protein L3K18_01070 [Thermoplasmata archaeon]|nr:hypothetical protein [Thermoplasmata archaeon]